MKSSICQESFISFVVEKMIPGAVAIALTGLHRPLLAAEKAEAGYEPGWRFWLTQLNKLDPVPGCERNNGG